MTVAKINRLQYFFVFPNLLFGKAIGVTAGVIVRKLGADTWLSMSFGFFFGLLIMLFMTYLCSKFPEKTIVEFAQDIIGKWPAKLLGLILGLFFIMTYAASASTLLLHLEEYFLPETPYFLLCIIYTALCMYGVFLGSEVVIRFSMIGFIMEILISIAMLTGTVGDIKPINLLPLMDKGIMPDVTGSFYVFGDAAMAILAVGFLFPMLNRKDKVFRITFWSMIIGSLMVIIWPLFEIMVLGPELMGQFVVVCMQQIRCAQLTKYLPRYELIMVSFFVFEMFVQASTMAFCAKHSFKQITNIKNDLVLIFPISVVMFLATYFMSKDHNNYINFLSFPYSQICAGLSIGLPLLLLLVGLFRGKLKSNAQDSKKNSKSKESS